MIDSNVAKLAGLNDSEILWINARLADAKQCEQDAAAFAGLADRARGYLCTGGDPMDGFTYDEERFRAIKRQFAELNSAADSAAKKIHEQIHASPYYKKYAAELGDVFGVENVELAVRGESGEWELIGDFTSVESAKDAAREYGGNAEFGISTDPAGGHYEITFRL